MASIRHRAVMVEEVLEVLSPGKGGTYIDGTVGGGGHAEAVLRATDGQIRLLGIDADEEAVSRARERLACWGRSCVVVHGNFADMAGIAAGAGMGQVDGVVLDLGLSSDQMASTQRGFSFEADGPLDMRMDRTRGVTAAALVNALPEEDLAGVLRRFGEEPRARRIARAIVRARDRGPIRTAKELARIIGGGPGGAPRRLHPATRTFMALRIAVNDELDSLRKGLEAGLSVLRGGGRLAVVSFHSLEDREVKGCFRRHAGRWESLPQGGRRWVAQEPAVRILTRKPRTPGPEEVAANPRSRSAKLRAAERV